MNAALRGHGIAVCFRRVGPYHHARLLAAGAHCRLMTIEFSGATDVGHPWVALDRNGIARTTLFEGVDVDSRVAGEVRQHVFNTLDHLKPTAVVVPGWSDRGALSALQWCLRTRRPAVLMSESTAYDRPRGWAREAIKRRIVRFYSAALVGGRRHSDYVRSLGVPDECIFQGYDAVDNGHFATGTRKVRARAKEWRERLELRRPFFLASSRFIPEKNLFRLLDAYAQYRRRAGSGHWQLVLLGDGMLRDPILRHIAALDLSMDVVLPGFKQYDELPIYYGLAGAFVHASISEPWGLVINEAMASSLPVVVSERCGCTPDLVRNGINGFIFDPYDVDQLTHFMLKVASDACDRNVMGRTSEEVIQDWGPKRFADGLRMAVQAAVEREPPSLDLADQLLLEVLLRR